jgi:anti-sigma B factor antagonist
MPGGAPANRNARVVTSETLSERGAVVIVTGDLDLASAPQLYEEVGDRIVHGHRHFVIDLTDATFIDSVAMQALLVAFQPLRAEPDAAVVLAGARGVVERSLNVSGLGTLFSGFAGRHAAADALARGEPQCSLWRTAAGRRPD